MLLQTISHSRLTCESPNLGRGQTNGGKSETVQKVKKEGKPYTHYTQKKYTEK